MNLNKSKDTILTSKQYNYGLGLLKVILAFCVIRTHNFNYNTIKNKILLYILLYRRIHVPSFFIMSFYFSHRDLTSSNVKLFLKRIERLLIPYLIWPIILFILNNYILNKFIILKKYSFNRLKNQFLIGTGVVDIFWFQWNLIVLTIIFVFIIRVFRKNHLFLILIFGCFSYFMQYSGYNHRLIQHLKREMELTLGRFFISVPFTSTGFILGNFKILNIIANYKIQTLILCILIFGFLEKYHIFAPIKHNNSYNGFLFNIKSICLVFVFSLFPSNKINNIKIRKILKHISNYTEGVYYLHIHIILYFKDFIKPIKNGTLFGLFIIYLICYFISFIGMQLFRNTKFKYLF